MYKTGSLSVYSHHTYGCDKHTLEEEWKGMMRGGRGKEMDSITELDSSDGAHGYMILTFLAQTEPTSMNGFSLHPITHYLLKMLKEKDNKELGSLQAGDSVSSDNILV